MIKKLKTKIKDNDQFGFKPETALIFAKKANYGTLIGGVVTVCMGLFFINMWYQNFL
jgi:hypothetical protein